LPHHFRFYTKELGKISTENTRQCCAKFVIFDQCLAIGLHLGNDTRWRHKQLLNSNNKRMCVGAIVRLPMEQYE